MRLARRGCSTIAEILRVCRDSDGRDGMRNRVGYILGALSLALVLPGCSKSPAGYSAEASNIT